VKGETWELTFPLKGANGVYRWFLTRGSAIKDEAGKVIRWIGTNTDITEQIKVEETLQKINGELQRTNDDLDNFIYTASHDLKAPILNIEGLMEALQDQLPPASLQAEDLQYTLHLITDSVQRFKRTIGHLTEVSKLQKENSKEATPVALAGLIAEVQMDLTTIIQEVQIRIEVEVTSCPTIRFSEKNLRSIIYNLLSNAIKYRSPSRDAWVQIQCSQTDEYQVLSVQDNGLGMDLSGKPKLFSMFKRLHDHVEGSGIGLYMVKKILENAGGKIEVQSTLGAGSTFLVYFRRSKAEDLNGDISRTLMK
jgi:signal transduction histidine kinase